MDEHTIERCPHDRENPYSITSNALREDNSISPECRFLLIDLIAQKDGWKTSVKYLIKKFGSWWGRDKVRKLINEAITAGYVKKELVRSRGSFNGLKYYISEYPKFKKLVPDPEKPSSVLPPTEMPGPITQAHNKYYMGISNINSVDKNKEYTSSPAASEFASFFFEKLKEMNPKTSKPNLAQWAKEIDAGRKKDNRSIEELKELVSFLLKESQAPAANFKWCKVVRSPKKLFQHFAAVWDAMQITKQTTQNSPTENAKIARKLETKFNDINKFQMYFGVDYIEFFKGASASDVIHFADKDFKQKVKLQLSKRNLKYNE